MKLRRNISVILSIILIALLVFYSGQSNAFNVSISTDKKTYFANSLIRINAQIETQQNEIIEIGQASIKIIGVDEENRDFSSVCILQNLDQGLHQECSQQDNRFVSVELIREDFGYGYIGYGYDVFNGRMIVNIVWKFEDWPKGNYNVIFSIKSGNTEYSSNSTFLGKDRLGNVAFICRTNDCNYGKEQSIITFLTDNGWTVEGKGYWSWGNEINNYKLIVCADELKACKIDGSHPAFTAHKNGIAFLEIADQPYANAAWRLGYTKNYFGLTSNEEMFITNEHPITQGFSGETDVLIGSTFNVIPDYQLSTSVIDLADSGNKQSSTLFVANKYAYVGWFNDKDAYSLTDEGSIILNRVIAWITSSYISIDDKPPYAISFSPVGELNTRKPLIRLITNEKAVCRFSLNQVKPYNQMEFEFPFNDPIHEYQFTADLANGNYTIYAKCKDLSGNEMSTVSLSFTINLPVYKDIAFICRTDECNYGIERDMIRWLEDRGWTVEGKGYWSWGNEINNYKLIVCADELKACKIDGSHPAFTAHKNGIAFLEIADQPYANAAWRLGYTKNYFGLTRSESLHITANHYITQNFTGSVNILTNPKFNVIQDYNLASSVIDLADSGNKQSSTLFVANKYAYVGWFGANRPEQLTSAGNLILGRTINWLILN
ncbi:MAG: hypothetical protein KQA41_03445 [Candidatus Aenigmarchaeota archaeon]|nr:hypothetical protein [Candidatus Aenigmarchaeota archaeon]